MAAANVSSWGSTTARHWEDERAELTRYDRHRIQTASLTAKGLPQGQAGHLSDRLLRLDHRYRHLAAGGWRTLSDELPGLPRFDQWKPDQPRANPEKAGRWIKYETPPGFPDGGGLLLPRVPDRLWELICSRQGLPFPADRSAGFWAWAIATPGLQLLITEGWKKALAALSAGHAAVALSGITMGWRGNAETGRRLIEALQRLNAPGRPWLIAFDAESKRSTAAKVGAAAGALARALRAAGGRPGIARLPLLPGTDKTGLDDLLAAAGIEALDRALADTGPRAALPRLRQPDLIAPAGQHLSDAVSPDDLAHPLVAVAAPMGAGKSWLARQRMAPFLETGAPVLGPTHRVALGESQAAAIGIPWAPQPGTVDRLQGAGLCWDSLRPSSSLQIRPDAWDGADGLGPALLGDEISQGIEHVLFGTGTAVAEHRPEVMATLAAMAARERFGLYMDAQLSEPVLQLLEALSGHRAFLIGSAHQPMAGRPVLVPQGLTARTAAEQGRARVLQLAKERRRVFVVTTAQQAHTKGAARNLARLVRRHWPEARILTIDSESPEAAELLGGDPNGIAAAYDWIICSPSITSGLSIDAPGLFDAVVVIGAGGRLTCEHLCQAAARVRDPRCPVEIYAPAIAPLLRIGSGDTDPAALLRHLARCEARLLADLVGVAGWDATTSNESPWLRCWLELSAHRNRQSYAYSVTISAMLEAEGWAVSTDTYKPPVELQQQATAELAEIADEAQAAADAAVITAATLTDRQARELARKRTRTPEERAQLARHQLDRRWGLKGATPSPELLEADRDGLNSRLRFAWILQNIEARQLAASHDRDRARQLAPNGKGWAPDLVRELLGHRIAAADALTLPAWLERGSTGEWFTADDPALLRLHVTATACRGDTIAALGIGPSKRASGTLRALLKLIGCRLEARRTRCGGGRRGWSYRVVPEALPQGADLGQLEAAWRQQLTDPS